jgi:hypothetical protein
MRVANATFKSFILLSAMSYRGCTAALRCSSPVGASSLAGVVVAMPDHQEQ